MPLSAIDNIVHQSQILERSLADLGKVLAGVQAPPEDSDALDVFLKELGYPYVEETDNAVYKRFMRS